MTSSTTDSHADVLHLCRLAGLPRATYYRRLARQDSKAAECELRDLIQRICLKHIFYGYRRDRDAQAPGHSRECQESS